MNSMLKRVFCTIAAVALGSVILAAMPGKSAADIIPYSVIAPHEYQLPVGAEIPKEGINLLLSYNTFRDEGKAWDGESGTRSLFANINKFVHIFNIEGLQNWGFLWEGVLGFGSLQGKGNITSETGMLDGQTGLVAWHRTAKNWTNVLEYWLYLPIGSDNLSGHSWNHSIAYMTNYHLGGFTFDGDIGYKLMGDVRDAGIQAEQGNRLFVNLVFAYKLMNQIEPFFKLDFQSVENGKDKTNGVKTPGFEELAWGLGNQFKISDRLNLAVWYEAGLTGRNTTKTNAGYARFIWTF
ncbi:MAG: transporter [Geobacteraceae bacterium]|nr:transporter [Geobacteraceae bacterium]